MPMAFRSSAIHCAAASPAAEPGPRPWKASSEIAFTRADMSAAVISGVVWGWAEKVAARADAVPAANISVTMPVFMVAPRVSPKAGSLTWVRARAIAGDDGVTMGFRILACALVAGW